MLVQTAGCWSEQASELVWLKIESWTALLYAGQGTAAPIESSGLQGLALCGPGSFACVKKETEGERKRERKKKQATVTQVTLTLLHHPPPSNQSQMWANQSIDGHLLCTGYTLHTSQTGHDAFKGKIAAAR